MFEGHYCAWNTVSTKLILFISFYSFTGPLWRSQECFQGFSHIPAFHLRNLPDSLPTITLHDRAPLFDYFFQVLSLTYFLCQVLRCPILDRPLRQKNEILGGAAARRVGGRLQLRPTLPPPLTQGANAQPSSRGRRRGFERELPT